MIFIIRAIIYYSIRFHCSISKAHTKSYLNAVNSKQLAVFIQITLLSRSFILAHAWTISWKKFRSNDTLHCPIPIWTSLTLSCLSFARYQSIVLVNLFICLKEKKKKNTIYLFIYSILEYQMCGVCIICTRPHSLNILCMR